jgi:hypothetical protein
VGAATPALVYFRKAAMLPLASSNDPPNPYEFLTEVYPTLIDACEDNR